MATAQAQGWAMGASPVNAVEDSPRLASFDQMGPSNDALARKPSIQPDVTPPNPPFVFPARLPSPSSAPTSGSRTSGRRPMSAIELHGPTPETSPETGDRPRRSIALPVFTFNPGASLPPDPDSITLLSPPITPNSARPIPSPSRHGHRRGGSEFVGGSIRDGNSIAIMSTSPTKSDSGFASPGLAPPPRRGHRRGVSGAISTSEVPVMHPLPDFTMPKGNSAPNSPTAFDPREGIPIPIDDQSPNLLGLALAPEGNARSSELSQGMGMLATPITPPLDMEGSSPRQARPVRARVGFSDKLEFIPRPLSLVSSDTSSTATARPGGHSVSGSISSIVSAASPGGRESPALLSKSPTRDLIESRPSTAGAILEHSVIPSAGNAASMSPKRRNSIPTLLNIAEAQASSPASPSRPMTKTPKRWSFFGLEPPFINSAPPSKRRPSSSSSTESVSRAVSGGSSSGHESDSTETGRDAPSCAKKTTKKKSKKKKVKGWADSFLPRKPRGNKKQSRNCEGRPPTPPASVGPCEDAEEAADDAETPDLELPAAKATMTNSPTVAQDTSSAKHRSKEDASQPMIDLDAALGPFNTPLPHNAEWEAAQRAAGNTGKRRLHSAQGLKGFSGPGMHYHRRAESAPDLPPFDAGRAGIHRFGSNPTMADVFEEDEDEEDASAKEFEGDDADDGEATPPATLLPGNTSPAAGPRSFEMTLPTRRTSSGPSEGDKSVAHSVRAEGSRTSLQEEVIVEENPSIIFRNTNVFYGGSDSAASSPRRLSGAKELSPVEVVPAYLNNTATMPISPYAASHASSSHPSPRSPMSIDAQRISTAPSSVTDENSFQSLLMGEPGPEVRISVDYDIPSLTSSNSTMTRDSVFTPNPRLSQPSLREQRPVSVSSAAFGRRRSSLVSLSRLISSSHGERSKLSMEVTLDNESENRRSKSKGSKTKQRLGRMMQFWKPHKDGDAPT